MPCVMAGSGWTRRHLPRRAGFVLKPPGFHAEEYNVMRFFRSEDGQGLVEYALVLVLVAVVVIAILALLGPYIGEWLNRAAEWFRLLLDNGA